MTTRTKSVVGSVLRSRLCSIENANRLAIQVADEADCDTVVVRTGNPVQPFRVVLANCADSADIVSRTLNCGGGKQSGQR